MRQTKDPLRHRNLLLYFLVYTLSHFECFNGFYALYLTDRGFSLPTVHMALAVSTSVRVLGELPSGALSDRFGDRLVMASGIATMMVFALLMLCAASPMVLLIAFVLYGLSITLTSGAEDGVLYRTVLGASDEHVKRIRPFVSATGHLSLALAAIVGGWLMQSSAPGAIFFTYLAVASGGLLCLFLIRATATGSDAAKRLHVWSWRAVAHLLSPAKRTMCIAAALALCEAVACIVFVHMQTHGSTHRLTLLQCGFAMAAVEVASAIGAGSSRVIRLHSRLFYFVGAIGVAGGLMAAVTEGSLMIAGTLVFLAMGSLCKVSAETLLIARVDQKVTATALSIFSLLVALWSGLLHLLFAAFLAACGSNSSFFLFAATATLALCATYGAARRAAL